MTSLGPPPTLPKEFDPVLWKIRRAQEHTEEAHRLAEDFFKTKFYALKPKFDRKGRIVFVITRCDPMPHRYGIVIGECAHQLRSILDHLIFPLAKPLTANQKKKICFPLIDHREDFKGRANVAMIGVPRGVRTIVERLQPYHRRNLPEALALDQIATIDNWDKHTEIMATAAATQLVNLQPADRFNVIASIETFTGILKPGAIIARLELRRGVRHAEMAMEPQFEFIPVFDNGMPNNIRGIPCLEPLWQGATFIQHTLLPMLKRFF